MKNQDIVVVIPNEEAPLSVSDLCPVSPQIEMASIAVHLENVGIGGPGWEKGTPNYRNAIRMGISSIVELLRAGDK